MRIQIGSVPTPAGGGVVGIRDVGVVGSSRGPGKGRGKADKVVPERSEGCEAYLKSVTVERFENVL